MTEILITWLLWFETSSYITLATWAIQSLYIHNNYYPVKIKIANYGIILICISHAILNWEYTLYETGFTNTVDALWCVVNISTATLLGYYKSMTEAASIKSILIIDKKTIFNSNKTKNSN